MDGKKKIPTTIQTIWITPLLTMLTRNKFRLTHSDHALRRLHGVTKQLQIRITELNRSQLLQLIQQQGVGVEPVNLKGKKNKTAAKIWLCSEPNCAYKTNSKCSLTMHMRIHTGAKPCVCQLCPCKFRVVQHLKRHVTLHHSTNENNQTAQPSRFICEVCQFPSSSSGNLKIHMRKHSNSRPFKCTLCEHATKHKSSLNAHIRTHTMEKPYKCNLCSHSCTQSGHLMQHIRSHTKETPIRCEQPECEFATTTKARMKMHLFQKHGCGVRDRKYKCELCPENRAFYTQVQLNHHIIGHTRQKPHQCQWCPRKYSRKWVKVEHEKMCAFRSS